MTLEKINRKLGWAVLISGITLALLAGVFTLMAGNATVLLVSALGIVAAQAGRVALRENQPVARVANERLSDLVAA